MADVPTTEQLLQDIAWMRRLATSLAGDRDEAEDLVQEATIAAWQRQPDPGRPMRGWLTKVMRDLAGMKRRSDRRRVARNARADDGQAPAAPDELLAQMRLHRRIVDLVIELDEPYRSTVIARFVEGRTSASIAESLGIPAGTVRKRLHEALSRLRAGLDASAGDRKAWAPAVLAFAQGGIYVAKPTKVAVAVIVLLLLASIATVIVFVTRDDRSESSPSTRSATTTTSTGTTPSNGSATTAATDARTPPPRSEQRAAMVAAIAKAREARDRRTATVTTAPTTPSTSTTGDGSATTLDIKDMTGDTSEWSKRALGTLNRLLGQCFDLGLAEDPSLAGNIRLRFTLVGEPDIGGLLEPVEILDEGTTISQQTIRDCLSQQLYALELDPPPAGVTVERELSLKVP